MGLGGLSGLSGHSGMMRGVFDSRAIPGYIADFDSRYGITLDGSNKVQQWDERWGNGMSYSQATAGNRPSYTANVFGGAPVVTGSFASQTYLTGNAAAKSALLNQTGVTFLCLYRSTDPTNINSIFGVRTNSLSTGRLTIGASSGARSQSGTARSGDGASSAAVSGPYIDIPNVFANAVIIDYANKTMKVFRNNVLVGKNASASVLTSPTPSTAAGDTTLMAYHAGAQWWSGDLVRMIMINGVLTEAQMASAFQGMRSEYPASVMPISNSSPSLLVQMQGASVTQGVVLPAYTPTLPDRLWQALGASDSRPVVNIGFSGATTSTTSTNRPLYVDIVPVSYASKIVYVLEIGFNDIVTGGLSGATVYNNVKTIMQAAKTARPGINTVLCTPPGSSTITTAQRTELVNLRDLELANAIADGIDAVCDWGGLAEYLTSSSSLGSDTTYYIDGSHPTDYGAVNRLVPALVNSINSLP